DKDYGYVVGSMGTLLKTTDSGENWEVLSQFTLYPLADVHFVDRTTGTYVGAGCTIFRTTDGGTSWVQQSSGIPGGWFSLNGVFFLDAHIGFIIGEWGTLLHTTDGGENWQVLPSGTGNLLMAVTFADAQNGTIVGHSGTILRTTTGGVTWIEEPKSSPSLFHLAQNYPNPVTSSTTIPFTLTTPEHVRLSVCDVLGREAAVLVEGKRMAGEQSVPFNAAGLRAGIYFSVLRTGSGVETRKMLIGR
ncbi:MAG: YCF48-related protein, partial [Bacteroidota bacterium]